MPERRSMEGNAVMDSTFHSVHRSLPSASRGRTMRPASSDALVRVSPPSSTSTDLPASAMCRATALPTGPLPTTTTSCFARGAASEEALADMRAGTWRDRERDGGIDTGRPGRDGLARANDSSRGDIAPTRLALVGRRRRGFTKRKITRHSLVPSQHLRTLRPLQRTVVCLLGRRLALLLLHLLSRSRAPCPRARTRRSARTGRAAGDERVGPGDELRVDVRGDGVLGVASLSFFATALERFASMSSLSTFSPFFTLTPIFLP